ncbi:hypothetical protein Tco_0164255 [Tanacetum coccineum]
MAKGQPKNQETRKEVFTCQSSLDGNEIDMYVEHFGYDIMELIKLEVNEEHNHNSIEESDDEYYGSDDYEEIENVDFQTEGDESVMIKSIKPLADPDDHQIHAVNKVQTGVLYPAFDPDIPWDKMEPTLCMRYETPYQNVEEGRCAGKKGNKDMVMKNKVRSGVQTSVKKKVVKKKVLKKKVVLRNNQFSNSGEGTSQSPMPSIKRLKPWNLHVEWIVEVISNGSATFKRIYIYSNESKMVGVEGVEVVSKSLKLGEYEQSYGVNRQHSIHSQPTQQSGVWVKDTTDVTIENLDEFPGMETSETTNVAEGIDARWAILKDMHVNYPYETQVDIVIASMALHNYIRMKDSTDDAFHTAQQETYNSNQDCDIGGTINETTEDTSSSSSRRDRDNDLYMSAVRDMIADELLISIR